MADLDFSQQELLEQAKGNEIGLWHATLLWAKQQPGGIDGWASFVGQAFAPSWDELGDASALEVARVPHSTSRRRLTCGRLTCPATIRGRC